MPNIPDISVINSDDPDKKIDSLIKQLNKALRDISNENSTNIYRSDLTTDAVRIGNLGDGMYGILLNDGTNDRLLIGRQDNGF